MPELNEGIATSQLASQTLVKCEWLDCKSTHQKKPVYPKGGTVARNGTYESDWVKAKLEPWELYGAGKNPRATLPDFRKETPKASYAINAAEMVHPEYHTQKHHLISVNLFESVTKLSTDAKLVGYDVNHKNNGICLPSYILDIVQHDLQCHRGSHTNALYNDKIKPMLRSLEIKCIKYCEMDINGDSSAQLNLLEDLNAISDRIAGKIKGWKFLVRKNALAERIESNNRFENLT